MNERKVGKNGVCVLFGWGWKRWEILVEPTSFLSYLTKTQFPQIGEKIGENFLDQIVHISFFLLFCLTRHKCVATSFFFFFLGFNWKMLFFSMIHVHHTLPFFCEFFFFVNFLIIFFISYFLLGMNFLF